MNPNLHLFEKTESYFYQLKSNIMFWHPKYWHIPHNIKSKLHELKDNYKTINSEMSLHENLVIASFFISGIICLTFSTIYHTFLCYSFEAQKLLGT